MNKERSNLNFWDVGVGLGRRVLDVRWKDCAESFLFIYFLSRKVQLRLGMFSCLFSSSFTSIIKESSAYFFLRKGWREFSGLVFWLSKNLKLLKIEEQNWFLNRVLSLSINLFLASHDNSSSLSQQSTVLKTDFRDPFTLLWFNLNIKDTDFLKISPIAHW